MPNRHIPLWAKRLAIIFVRKISAGLISGDNLRNLPRCGFLIIAAACVSLEDEMSQEERYPLIFDKEFTRWAMSLGKSTIGAEVIPVGSGAPIILDHKVTNILASSDNVMMIRTSEAARLSDSFHPVVDTDTKKPVGVFFPRIRFWKIHPGITVRKGTRLEFGRFLTFVPSWTMIHFVAMQKYGYPGAVLLIMN